MSLINSGSPGQSGVGVVTRGPRLSALVGLARPSCARGCRDHCCEKADMIAGGTQASRCGGCEVFGISRLRSAVPVQHLCGHRVSVFVNHREGALGRDIISPTDSPEGDS